VYTAHYGELQRNREVVGFSIRLIQSLVRLKN
jgi:hypothetical protein